MKKKDTLTLDHYQELAISTAVYPEKIALGYTIIGLGGEAGELLNVYKKALRDDNGMISEDRKEKLISELGDCLWYSAAIAKELGMSLQEVAEKNLQKLADRSSRGTIRGSGEER